MGKRSNSELRVRIAQEAARLMSESGLRDYAHAKRKAAQRLGAHDEREWPKNTEIEDALREHQRLFLGDKQTSALRRRREVALEAMQFFRAFEPKLVGAVLEGTADEHSAVCLHLFADHELEVHAVLDEARIPFECESRRVRMDRETTREFPVIQFAFEDIALDLTIFPHDFKHQAPLDRIDEKPMARGNLQSVLNLLQVQ